MRVEIGPTTGPAAARPSSLVSDGGAAGQWDGRAVGAFRPVFAPRRVDAMVIGDFFLGDLDPCSERRWTSRPSGPRRTGIAADRSGRGARPWPTPIYDCYRAAAASSSSSATAAAAPTPPTSARTSAKARCAARTSTTTTRNALRILSLTDNTPYILAWGNDEGFDRVFVEQLKNLASPGDLLIAISGSGNSPNILRAVEWANRNGLTHLRLHRLHRRQARELAQHNLHVPLDDMGIVESIHLTAFHWVVDDLHRRIAAFVTASEQVPHECIAARESGFRHPVTKNGAARLADPGGAAVPVGAAVFVHAADGRCRLLRHLRSLSPARWRLERDLLCLMPPGMAWSLAAVRATLGGSSLAARVADLGIVAAVIALLAGWLAARRTVVRGLRLGRGPARRLLPHHHRMGAGAAGHLDVPTGRGGADPAPPTGRRPHRRDAAGRAGGGLALLEGVLWGTACLFKPFVVVPGLAAWLASAAVVRALAAAGRGAWSSTRPACWPAGCSWAPCGKGGCCRTTPGACSGITSPSSGATSTRRSRIGIACGSYSRNCPPGPAPPGRRAPRRRGVGPCLRGPRAAEPSPRRRSAPLRLLPRLALSGEFPPIAVSLSSGAPRLPGGRSAGRLAGAAAGRSGSARRSPDFGSFFGYMRSSLNPPSVRPASPSGPTAGATGRRRR